jgi:hypothetical protein
MIGDVSETLPAESKPMTRQKSIRPKGEGVRKPRPGSVDQTHVYTGASNASQMFMPVIVTGMKERDFAACRWINPMGFIGF